MVSVQLRAIGRTVNHLYLALHRYDTPPQRTTHQSLSVSGKRWVTRGSNSDWTTTKRVEDARGFGVEYSLCETSRVVEHVHIVDL